MDLSPYYRLKNSKGFLYQTTERKYFLKNVAIGDKWKRDQMRERVRVERQ